MITEFKNAAREKDFPVRDLSFLFIAINAKYVHTNLAVSKHQIFANIQ